MIYKVSETQNIDFGNMDSSFFLIGLLNEFMNRFQSYGDRFFEVISWKQCFLLICLQFFEEPPTLMEIAQVLGCSHQNVKQMVLRLEKLEYVVLSKDADDKRKMRISMTQKANEFSKENDRSSKEFMEELFKGINKEDLEVTIRTIMQMNEQLKKSKY